MKSGKDLPSMTNRRISDPYISLVRCARRLANEYERHGTLYVAFDFDNTVYDYHNQGYEFDRVESILKDCKEYGLKLILFTAKETQDELDQCVSYCKKRGYEPDYVNESPIMKTSKPYYNILLDDRAGLESAASILEEVIHCIKYGDL